MDGSGRRTRNDRDGGRYTLAALTEVAGVSVRTVRYYISEGLLPPPVGAGPASHYTDAHLNRLALIGRLKEAYLPLKEIRRRLTGLGDAEVAALLAEEGAREAELTERLVDAPDDALSYIDRVLNPAEATRDGLSAIGNPLGGRLATRRGGGESAARPREPAALGEASPAWDAAAGADDGSSLAAAQVARPFRSASSSLAARPPEDPIDHGQPWLRIPLGDEAELLVSDGLLRRHGDKVDWLVRWARKVFR